MLFLGAPSRSGIEKLANGWFRCWISVTVPGTSATLSITISNGTNASYTGDGSSGFYAWGAQIEVGPIPSSYVPTTSASVTRSADLLIRSNADSFINAMNEFSLFSETVVPYVHTTNGNIPLEVNNNSFDNRYGLFIRETSLLGSFVITGGVTEGAPGTGSYTGGLAARLGLACAVDDIAMTSNGASPATDTAAALGAITQMNVGSRIDAGQSLFGIVKRIAYFPRRISNAQLQTITT